MSEGTNITVQEPFAIQTKLGGVVACINFIQCAAKADGAGCIDCSRNRYSQTKKVDNFSPPIELANIVIDHLTGVCEFGDVRLVIGPTYDQCHVFLNGKLIDKDVLGFQIEAEAGKITICELYLRLVKLETTRAE